MTAETAMRQNPTANDIRARCRAHVLDSAALCKASGNAYTVPTPDHEAACDAIADVGLWWLKRHARHARRREDMRTEKDFRERFFLDCQQSAENIQVHPRSLAERPSLVWDEPVSIGIIMGGLLSWLIGRVLDWLWNWWTRDGQAAAVVVAME